MTTFTEATKRTEHRYFESAPTCDLELGNVARFRNHTPRQFPLRPTTHTHYKRSYLHGSSLPICSKPEAYCDYYL